MCVGEKIRILSFDSYGLPVCTDKIRSCYCLRLTKAPRICQDSAETPLSSLQQVHKRLPPARRSCGWLRVALWLCQGLILDCPSPPCRLRCLHHPGAADELPFVCWCQTQGPAQTSPGHLLRSVRPVPSCCSSCSARGSLPCSFTSQGFNPGQECLILCTQLCVFS